MRRKRDAFFGLLFAVLLFPILTGTASAQDHDAIAQQPAGDVRDPKGDPQSKDPSQAATDEGKPERWNLSWQATSVGQYHGQFASPYAGANSLENVTERDASLTTTLFFGLRLARHTEFYFNPEIAGGRGFSHVLGLANSSNGELPRVATATPKPYIARLYISQDFGFGSGTEHFDGDDNQLAGDRPIKRYTITVGRFTLTDFFDDNRYSHDPRTQFLGWAVMYNGAWDYPADVRGYTWGMVHELHTRDWSLRYGSAAEPRVANGLRFDRRLFRDRSDDFEEERRFKVRGHPGTIRALEYINHAAAGTYAQAIAEARRTGRAPSIIDTRQIGTLKYGFGVSADQELTSDVGVFTRLGWNDGKTESFAFTAIDRLATGGISVTGQRWRRPADTVAAEFTASGLSAVHSQYLALGGLDFLIGDGHLQYGPESIFEAYYSARLFPGFVASFDLQHVANPAYNQDRGPLWIYSLRLHWEIGKADFVKTKPRS